MKRGVDGGLIGEGLVDSMPMINENNLGSDSNLQFYYYYFSSLLLWPVSEGTTKNDMDFTAPPVALDVQDGLGSDRRCVYYKCSVNGSKSAFCPHPSWFRAGHDYLHRSLIWSFLCVDFKLWPIRTMPMSDGWNGVTGIPVTSLNWDRNQVDCGSWSGVNGEFANSLLLLFYWSTTPLLRNVLESVIDIKYIGTWITGYRVYLGLFNYCFRLLRSNI